MSTSNDGVGLIRPERRGPAEGEDTLGVDLSPERRPGVPRAADPADVEAVEGAPVLTQLEGRDRTLYRAGLDHPTRVFGTAQARHGVSGLVRRGAYGIPEQYARHWMILLLADRLEVLENRIRSHPVRSLGIAAAALLAWRIVR